MKKVIALVLCFTMMLSMVNISYASDLKVLDKNKVELNGFTYTMTENKDGSFAIRSFKDGVKYDEVTGFKGGDNLVRTEYISHDSKVESEQSSFDNLKIEKIKVEKILSKTSLSSDDKLKADMFLESSVTSQLPSLMTVRSSVPSSYTYEGKIDYNDIYLFGMTYDYNLNFYSKINDTVYGTYNMNSDAGTAITVIISALVAVFTYGTISLWVAVLIAIGAPITNNILNYAFSRSLTGYITSYYCGAEDTDTDRTNFYEGVKIEMTSLDTNTGTSITTYEYDGIYPKLFHDESTALAYWLYCDFWDGGTYPGVDNWY
ncbi:hypothetical protein [Vallitalea guaymasensis]|uniref:hypothetical protein n=1 Tax=Vallitalea guaymasensis TaxID=1185412 RepID=UPI00272A4C4D|nr:hypothetical protein [Vallitalea guaymasensis]